MLKITIELKNDRYILINEKKELIKKTQKIFAKHLSFGKKRISTKNILVGVSYVDCLSSMPDAYFSVNIFEFLEWKKRDLDKLSKSLKQDLLKEIDLLKDIRVEVILKNYGYSF